jgi:hypothetical protein
VLMLVMYDFPQNKAGLWRWSWFFAITVILALPLLFQPNYGQGKLEGLFISNQDAIAHYGIGFMMTSQLIYSFFSYIYIINESHFVTSSLIDPISAIFIPAGMAWLAVQWKRNKFALFWILSFAIMWFLAGASHGRQFPPNTRMFMLLPWWTSFAAFGITWLAGWIERITKSHRNYHAIIAIWLVFIGIANLVQVYWIFPQRYAGTQSLEILFLRLTQLADRGGIDPVYLFITDESWSIDGLRVMQDLYHSPPSESQLDRVVMIGTTLEPEQLVKLQAPDTVVISQPWLKPEWLDTLTPIMLKVGKAACDIRDTAKSDIKFTAYFPQNMAYLCPFNGNWND